MSDSPVYRHRCIMPADATPRTIYRCTDCGYYWRPRATSSRRLRWTEVGRLRRWWLTCIRSTQRAVPAMGEEQPISPEPSPSAI